jgi:hypothetical protein
MNIFEQLKKGIFYDCPDSFGIKELFFNESEQYFGISLYLYSKVIDVHNISITDHEFATKLLMHPSETFEFHHDTNEYKNAMQLINANNMVIDNIADIFGIKASIKSLNTSVPYCIGMDRQLLYSVASSHLLERTCEDCLHSGQCDVLRTNVTHDVLVKDCGMFLDRNVICSEKTFKTLRMYFSNAFSNIGTFDDFTKYCKDYNLNRELLRSLNISYIVFVSHYGPTCYSGHSQIYNDKTKAIDYANAIAKTIVSEANRFGNANTIKTIRTDCTIEISYERMFAPHKTHIQIVEI